jgi:hypothetical protein
VTSNCPFLFQTTWVLDSHGVFSQLRHVQIVMIMCEEDEDKILYIVSLLRVAPFLENLEVHVSIFTLMVTTNYTFFLLRILLQ